MTSLQNVSQSNDYDPDPKFKAPWWFGLSLVACLIAILTAPYYVPRLTRSIYGLKAPELAQYGQFGDMFGALTAAFTVLAFGALLFATLMQRHELELQRKELRENRIQARTGVIAQKELASIEQSNRTQALTLQLAQQIKDAHMISSDKSLSDMAAFIKHNKNHTNKSLYHFLDHNYFRDASYITVLKAWISAIHRINNGQVDRILFHELTGDQLEKVKPLVEALCRQESDDETALKLDKLVWGYIMQPHFKEYVRGLANQENTFFGN